MVSHPERGPLRGEALDEFGRQLWEAVAYFAGVGMAHRDLSARNVMLRRGDQRVVIVDWGTGRQDGTDGTQTQHGLRSFTPGFGSPEQVVGDGYVGPLADVWGWGSVMYYAATGHPILPAADGDEYADALGSATAIEWADIPERWLPALQAALVPIKERDPTVVGAFLPLRPLDRELRNAVAAADRAEAAVAALNADLAGKVEVAQQDRQRLSELDELRRHAEEEVSRLRDLLRASVESVNDKGLVSPAPPSHDAWATPRPSRPFSWLGCWPSCSPLHRGSAPP